ncbi:MAG: hypothetical protein J7578_05505 [Chitinophagaceae bacterium]|nr:hypothetical protein [Chitinophagaceae bacterium]
MVKVFSKYSIYILLAIAACSCDFKDKGNFLLEPISNINIDTTGIPLQRSIPRDSVLIIDPLVSREGVAESNFNYQWYMTLKPGADFNNARIISNEKKLSVPMEVNPSTDYYSIWFKVTDKTTGLKSGIVWQVVVQPPTNQGLVIADSDDGLSSDLSVVQDTLFTTNWFEKGTTTAKATVYKRNEFSNVNGRKITGLMHSLFAQRLYYNGLNTNFLHGASKNNAFRISTLDYKMIAEGNQLFYDASVNLNIDYYFLNGSTNPWMMNAGKVSNRIIETSSFVGIRKFSIEVPGNYKANRAIAVHPTINQNAIFYDENLGRFLRFGTSLNVKAAPFESTTETTPFAANNLPGYTALGGGLGGDLSEARFVLKKGAYYGVFCLTYTGSPRRVIDISSAPDIANAVSFVFPSDQAVIYYATANKVYSIRIPQGGSPSYSDLYTSPDPITMLEMVRRSGTLDVTYSERCLLAVTYNGSEGKVTALPIPADGLGLGTIDLTRKAIFGGFKKISAVAIQE